jgi:hypothetical protein
MSFGLVHKLCEHCSHAEVCSLKDVLRKARADVDSVIVGIGDREAESLAECDWICADIQCKHYTTSTQTRGLEE